jgi:hypothetical protein
VASTNHRRDFGGPPDRYGSRLTAQASAILAAEHDERGKTPVLVGILALRATVLGFWHCPAYDF